MNKNSLSRKRQKLSGPEGLYSAVIAQATQDALFGAKPDKVDALRYLRSDWYRSHLNALGKPPDWLPAPEE